MLKLSSIPWGEKLQKFIEHRHKIGFLKKKKIYSLYLKIIFCLHVSYLMLSYFTCFDISKNLHILIVLQELCMW